MANVNHANLDTTNIHVAYAWAYANAAARTGASGFSAGDVGKFARQTDDNSIWILTATTPTWAQVGGSAVGDVVGPGSSTNGNLAVFDGTDGKLLKDGGAPAAGGADILAVQVFS